MKVYQFVTFLIVSISTSAYGMECLSDYDEITTHLNNDEPDSFAIDRDVDLTNDGEKEVIYSELGCGYLCDYHVFQKQNGCFSEIKYFRAREYFIEFNESSLRDYISPELISKHKEDGAITPSCHSYIIANVYEPEPDSDAPEWPEEIPYEILCIH